MSHVFCQDILNTAALVIEGDQGVAAVPVTRHGEAAAKQVQQGTVAVAHAKGRQALVRQPGRGGLRPQLLKRAMKVLRGKCGWVAWETFMLFELRSLQLIATEHVVPVLTFRDHICKPVVGCLHHTSTRTRR